MDQRESVPQFKHVTLLNLSIPPSAPETRISPISACDCDDYCACDDICGIDAQDNCGIWG